MRLQSLATTTLCAMLACIGCHEAPKKKLPPGSPVATSEAFSSAATLFRDRCAACHGATGHGEGINTLKPQDFTDAAWQLRISDDELRMAIVKGGKGVGKSEAMPANPDLESKPEIVNDLIVLIRAMKR